MILYKYYPCDQNTFRSLAMSGLWCHAAEHMNDPFECLADAPVVYDTEELEEFREHVRSSPPLSDDKHLARMASSSDEKLLQMLQMMRAGYAKKFAFCALSERPDDILMWSHYAASHSGCVIGFELPVDGFDSHFQKVQYANASQKLDLKAFADFTGGQLDEGVGQLLSDISIKADVWGYEKEWRIWRKQPGYFIYQRHQLKKIYFGVKTPDAVQAAVAMLIEGADRSRGFECTGRLQCTMEMKFDPLRIES